MLDAGGTFNIQQVQLQTHQQVNRVDLAKRIDIPSKSMDDWKP